MFLIIEKIFSNEEEKEESEEADEQVIKQQVFHDYKVSSI